ncbi:MAG TPA: hypothetical protein VMV50_03610 [Candidatus Paceibacterota bacterium]|nr:hypothetical protein [Candidatus Paceibacterota bacterium]
MSHMRLWAAASIIAVVIVIGFFISAPHASEVAQVAQPQAAAATAPVVTLHDAYRRGAHTITGSLMAPDACMIATATSTLVGSASTSESIAVSISMPADSGVCLELPTKAVFSTTIAAPAGLPISATVNGAAASTTSS